MASLNALRDELRRSIDGEVRFDGASLALYSTDASNYRRLPVGVVIPRHEDDVAKAVALARENGIPVLPRGGGTALAGQTTNTALVLDFSKYMNRVIRVDPERTPRHRSTRPRPGASECRVEPVRIFSLLRTLPPRTAAPWGE